MSLLWRGGSNYIGVRDVEAACAWYCDKLGMRKVKIELDDGAGCITLGFEKDEAALVLGPPVDASRIDELSHIFFTSNAKKAREFLNSRGVNVGEIDQDEQGTRHFEMRDPDGNVIEISEEP